MKEQTAVINRDVAPYVETWKKHDIAIEPGHAIVMTAEDANKFMGTYSGQDRIDPTKPKPKNLAKIPAKDWKGKVDMTIGGEERVRATIHICNYCGTTFPELKHLNEHLKTHSDKAAEPEEEEKLKSIEEPVQCPFCGQEDLKGHKGLKTHLAQHCKAIKGEVNDPSGSLHANTVAS